MKVYFDALGCPKALVDAERMCFFLEKDHHTLVATPDEADAVIINTCGFIEKAKQESIEAILGYTELKKTRPGLKVILSGCLTERYKNELLESLPEVDAAIGVRDLTRITATLTNTDKKIMDEGPYQDRDFDIERELVFSGYQYAYIKISEGCNRSCSFCAIPGIRGKQRSRTIESVLKEANYLLDQGVKELILVSEDTMSYGTDIYQRRALLDLLKELDKLAFQWIRVMYLFPDDDILAVVSFLAGRKKFCQYIDIPLQHVSQSVLQSMKRPGSKEKNQELIRAIRQLNPEIKIRSSFIVGYPGETKSDFNELKAFLQEARLDRVGFFEYSDEEDTASFTIEDKVTHKTALSRINELTALQDSISRENLNSMIGKQIVCINDGLIEEENGKSYLMLRTEFDAPEIDGRVAVELDGENSNAAAGFVQVKITKVRDSHDLEGTLVDTDNR